MFNKRKSHLQRMKFCMKPTVAIANTDPELIEKCAETLNSFSVPFWVTHSYRKWRDPRNKDQSAIVIAGLKRVDAFLNTFGDHLRKQMQVDIFRQFIEHRLSVGYNDPYTDFEYGLYDKLRMVNQKGTLNDYTSSVADKATMI